MNELIILFLICAAMLTAMFIGCPIAYMVYRFRGGESGFWKWFIFEN